MILSFLLAKKPPPSGSVFFFIHCFLDLSFRSDAISSFINCGAGRDERFSRCVQKKLYPHDLGCDRITQNSGRVGKINRESYFRYPRDRIHCFPFCWGSDDYFRRKKWRGDLGGDRPKNLLLQVTPWKEIWVSGPRWELQEKIPNWIWLGKARRKIKSAFRK